MARAVVVFVLVGMLAIGALGPAASAGDGLDSRRAALVFVQTNELDGNRIVVYRRDADGRLTEAGTYETEGLGGVAAPGDESDRLASQGSLVYDRKHSVLLAVNAGSNSVSVFRVRGDRLRLSDVDLSGGEFPASIAVHGDLVYVLNAGGAGVVQGFRLHGGELRPLGGSARTLGLANAVPPNFLTSPGQIGFTPDGAKLIVTTKASGSKIVVFDVMRDGLLADPAVNDSATPVPFAFTFDRGGRLVVGEAGTSSVTTYTIGHDGTLKNAQSLSNGQVALCWIERVGDFFYVANTGSNTLSGYRLDRNGKPSLLGANGIVATTEAGPIDLAAASDAPFLYGQTGTAGTIDEYRVNRDGSLTKLGVITGLPQGMEGIAAT
jgi:DNA-binding beta-propeller fold protein YncE